MPPQSWWNPQKHADRSPGLRARSHIKKALRAYFDGAGFTEVECGILQRSPGNEAHLHAFATAFVPPTAARVSLYLHTSPEFACKKLLTAGEDRIFEFARVFRNRERGVLHAPEFTMLEWYRANAGYDVVIRDCIELLGTAAHAAGSERLSYRGRTCDPLSEPERLTVAEAFERFAAVDLLATVDAQGGDRDALALAAQKAGIEAAGDDTWSDLFSKILVARIEPRLGVGRPAILYEYPRSEAALARVTPRDARVAERFELYACGVELANGFGELTDPVEQRRRFEAEMTEMERTYGERYPLDEDFLAALSHMPEASGVALGFDRLVMLALGAPSIDDVIWTPLPDGIG